MIPGLAELRSWQQGSKTELESVPGSPQSVRSVSSLSSSSSSRPKIYFCDYEGCNKSFARPSTLTEHQDVVHRGIRPFKCNQCEESFTKQIHLERHLWLHTDERPFHCSQCGKGVVTQQHLKRHEITHTKSFKCTYPGCNEAFYRHPTLRSHILSTHRKLICEHCNKELKSPAALRHHETKFHNPNVVNPYQCTFTSCAQGFKTWTALQVHIKNDHPKLRCEVCSKPCVGEQGLKMHMKVHDESLVAKNWKCSICDSETFAKKNELIAHFENNHRDKLPPPSLAQSLLPPKENETSSNECSDHNDEQHRSRKRKISELDHAQQNLEQYFVQGKSGMDLLLNTVGRKKQCYYDKCYRTFKTEERYQQHIGKHKIHDLKMKVLQDKQEEEMRNENGKQTGTSGKIEEI
ncbi:hypothetical protein ZYGR_0N00210 [Zygosaccharomyces rouxii]|uniref:Transcription factor IIIA n=2 Tax=Zygosaccharomyces rouxii TaxID=4956 RepID=C5DUS1_ZYGRC|nr:uncharacterized protein ZYRO0D00902g [Zygosaccharomyces rouxii]KAH9200457.1 hypothetical protein LQ764DRAFT_95011 [Zygosaccharomyces rouxii]GAV48617.1 hypothetical protein ZYGR_0N00210 [Zygosaccharomyces rouxii]CAR27540.1 ZYRO0D00902p [Zygosaccharomyces rouxii]